MKYNILVIGGGYPQLELIEAAKDMGHDVTVVDDRKECPGVRLADHVLHLNRYDCESILEAVQYFKVNAVVSGGADKAVWVMAKVAERYELPTYVASKVAELSMQKGLLRRLYEKSDLPVPRSVEVGTVDEGVCKIKCASA